MADRRFFPRVGKLRGLETKVPQQGAGVEPRWDLGAKPTKNCENNA